MRAAMVAGVPFGRGVMHRVLSVVGASFVPSVSV